MKALRRSRTEDFSLTDQAVSRSPPSAFSSSLRLHLRSIFVAVSSTPSDKSPCGSAKSPLFLGKGKRALSRRSWRNMISQDGRIRDGGVKFLKKVRSGGVDPSIRAEVWPFLLGVYDLKSSKAERSSVGKKKRKVYDKLRGRCLKLRKALRRGHNVMDDGDEEVLIYEDEGSESPASKTTDSCSRGNSPSIWGEALHFGSKDECIRVQNPLYDLRGRTSRPGAGFSDSEDEEEDVELDRLDSIKQVSLRESNLSWQRIMRIDAVRVDSEWAPYSPSQASVSKARALEAAVSVGLKDYDHLEPCVVYHAARLVALLEAYALYDPEIGYCQGMSDLLSPIVAVLEDDCMAFWCFVGFMRKARHNFRLDEVGIRRQLSVVARIIERRDPGLYRHLEKLQAEDCFFAYRMVVVMFRRELGFEQAVCLWEVMWAEQAAIRARIGNSVWGRIRMLPPPPPTEDLLLFAIAACVLRRRRRIIEKHRSRDELLRECNEMAGKIDVWRMLDAARALVFALHDEIRALP